jgi:arylsulfatase A-like enzyme
VAESYRTGYEYWLASNHLEKTSDAYRTRLFDAHGNPNDLPGYRVDALTDATIRFLAEPRTRPFFLFTSFLEPHHQNSIDDYPPPEGYRQRYSGRWTPPDLQALGGSTAQHLGGYFGMVKRLDEALGRVMDALISLKLHRNTIVLFTSDHGCHFKTRTIEYKRSPHESSIRVPCFLAGPGFKGGGEVQSLVSLVDLPPTLIGAAGLPIPETMQGKPVHELIGRQRSEGREDVFVQISESQIGRAVRSHRWKYAVKAPGVKGVNPRRKSAARYAESALYDLENDPHELRNLIGLPSHRQVADRMQRRLLEHIRTVEGKAPRIINARLAPGGHRVVQPEEIEE